jgi:hypothetical protein
MSIHNTVQEGDREREREREKKSHVEYMNFGVKSSKTCFTVCDLYILLLPCMEQTVHCIYLFAPPTFHRSMKGGKKKPVGYITCQDNTYTCL